MLDLDDPRSQPILAAARLLDAVKRLSQSMTLAAAPERQGLLGECQLLVESLHRLNDEHFAASEFIYEALLRLDAALQVLAGDEDSAITQSDGAACPRCGSALTHIGTKYLQRSLCSPCLGAVSAAEAELEGFQGFGTLFI